jgi:hypothetical protein
MPVEHAHLMTEMNDFMKAVHDKMPKDWFALARPTHQAFVAVAQEAASPTASAEAVVGKLTAAP